MHPCAARIQEVNSLMDREEAALDTEDGEGLDVASERRAAVLAMAWELRAGYDESLLRRQLSEICERQTRLETKARAVQEQLRADMASNKKQSNYLAGDRYERDQRKKSFYLNQVS